MAKRFTDTDKWSKPFIRSLDGPLKLLYLYILDQCDNAGIWQEEFDVVSLRLGFDYDKEEVLEAFKGRVIEFRPKKWFIVDFIGFQYGTLNRDNRAHTAVIRVLLEFGLINDNLELSSIFFDSEKEKNKGLTSPLQGDKDKDKDKDRDRDKDRKGGVGGNQIHSEANRILLHLRDTSGREFSPGMANTRHIIARLEEGHPPEDLINVIDLKVWQSTQHRKDGDLVFKREWLAPNTLFRKDQFEKYLNEVKEIQNGTADANPYQHPAKARAGNIKKLYEELGIDPLEGFGFSKSSGEDGSDVQPGHTFAGAGTS